MFIRTLVVLFIVGCGTDHRSLADARPPSTVPHDPGGRFAVASTLDMRVPPSATTVVDKLVAMTDGPDDPSRYLVDRMIAALPDGTIKTIATGFAPLVAAYLNEKLADVAPSFASGIAVLAHDLQRIATHVVTLETFAIDPSGRATRTITGVRFELGAPVDADLPTTTASATVMLDRAGHLAIAAHAVRLPYGVILRRGLDRAAIPNVVPTANDLATALGVLVDCAKLGDLASQKIGIGTPTLYRAACKTAMLAIANEVYTQLDTIDAMPLELDVTGAALGVDHDGNGTMDAITSGTWTGSIGTTDAREPLDAAMFTGAVVP